MKLVLKLIIILLLTILWQVLAHSATTDPERAHITAFMEEKNGSCLNPQERGYGAWKTVRSTTL